MVAEGVIVQWALNNGVLALVAVAALLGVVRVYRQQQRIVPILGAIAVQTDGVDGDKARDDLDRTGYRVSDYLTDESRNGTGQQPGD